MKTPEFPHGVTVAPPSGRNIKPQDLCTQSILNVPAICSPLAGAQVRLPGPIKAYYHMQRTTQDDHPDPHYKVRASRVSATRTDHTSAFFSSMFQNLDEKTHPCDLCRVGRAVDRLEFSLDDIDEGVSV